MRHLLFPALFIFLTGLLSCRSEKETAQDAVSFTVERADEWTALFDRSRGWFGGDGIFAIPFSGADSGEATDSVLFLFSDTMVGEIVNDSLKPGYVMINNSCMIVSGRKPLEAKARFLTNPGGGDKPSSLFVPTTPSTKAGDYYWLGDGFVNVEADSSLYIFAYRIQNTNDGSLFPFREVGNALIEIPAGSKYPFAEHRQMELPFNNGDSTSTSFGVGIHVSMASDPTDTNSYVYVYGIKGKNKSLLAARVKPEEVKQFSKWEFYGGDSWTSHLHEAAPLADSVSNELSVTPIGEGKYALVYQYGGIMPTICMQVGPTPVGPFGPRQKVWDTTKDIKEKGLFTYNAKAHPAISEPGELLVSYNVNSFDFFNQIGKIPNLYRPRFVRIVFDKK